MNSLGNDQTLDRFRIEFEKLYRTLRTSTENEKKLLSKCKNLNSDIISHTAKVQAALKLTQEDSQTINFLKSELERMYKMLEVSRDREEKSKQKIENLTSEIKHLSSLLEQDNNMNSGQNTTVQELLNFKEELIKGKKNQIRKEPLQL